MKITNKNPALRKDLILIINHVYNNQTNFTKSE